MSIDIKLIGKRIKRKRKTLHITQADLAAACDICDTYLSYIESGIKTPSLEVIDKLASALGITVADLLGGKQTSRSESYCTKITEMLEKCTPEEQRLIYTMMCTFLDSLRR